MIEQQQAKIHLPFPYDLEPTILGLLLLLMPLLPPLLPPPPPPLLPLLLLLLQLFLHPQPLLPTPMVVLGCIILEEHRCLFMIAEVVVVVAVVVRLLLPRLPLCSWQEITNEIPPELQPQTAGIVITVRPHS